MDPNANPLPAPQVAPAQAPAQPLVIDQAALIQILATLQQAQQCPTQPVPPTPRCGGVSATLPAYRH
jgi:hypothetical protein